MRITQGMLSNNMLRNINSSYSALDRYMDQLSSGKKINRPSDDPVIAMKGMNYRTEVSNIEQYDRNLSEMYNWMDNSDDALNEATEALKRLRDLAVQASNGVYDEGQRTNIAEEVDQLKQHLAEIANTKVNNKYLFNGTKTTGNTVNGELQKPVEIDEDGNVIVTRGEEDYNAVLIEVTAGTRIQANVNPDNVFAQELFDELEAFSELLKSGAPDAEIDQYISVVDKHINNVVNERAELGARMNRVDLIKDRLSSQANSAKRMMSDNEDADIAAVLLKLTSQEAVHRAALSAGSRVIQPSLIDFLR
ncbi:flagellar hook-associated protein 3 FlgL [Amphibacillus marinus]|uniref:Flagellar hook-associated protein 3 FlgL n=1 Tax=Amphibacillus marinus TaxID=872970 RepID=A0A1H8QZ51_9BACI|nr:flagellar hook-associated protein FlgL [Amphibacillus marinus]SEO59148.1 flagellar hook-associated protein 3 FlgL [Amphibacillus marinus]